MRFAVGGSAVVLCYVLARLSPWKAFGGMFAAFPAVMAAAVGMAGLRGGRGQATDTAIGAVSGMLAGTACVASCLFFVAVTHSWRLSLALAMAVWFFAAAAFSSAINPRLLRYLGAAQGGPFRPLEGPGVDAAASHRDDH